MAGQNSKIGESRPAGGPRARNGTIKSLAAWAIIQFFGTSFVSTAPASLVTGLSCEHVFLEKPVYVWRIADAEPTDYIGAPTTQKRGSLIDQPLMVSNSLRAFNPENEPEKYYWIRSPIYLKFESFDWGNKILSMRDVLQRREFRVEEVPGGLSLTEIPPRSEAAPALVDPPRNFSLLELNNPAFAERDLSVHLLSSSTTSAGKSVEELKHAYGLMLTKLHSGEAWSVKDIEAVNRTANVPQGRVHWADLYLKYGVVRGTRKTVVLQADRYERRIGETSRETVELAGEGHFLVDFSHTEVFDQMHGHFYLPARMVPAALRSWLLDFNQVDASTSLRRIVALYRGFIVMHPFGDGNGRTGRILLDAMLMKAGFGPLPAGTAWIGDILFQDLDRVTADLAKAYQD